MNALARLILRRKDELGLTWKELAAAGGWPSHTIIHSLAMKAEHKQPPRNVTLERLAKALDVPLDLVRAAAAEAAGLRLEEIKMPLDVAEDVRIVAAAMGELSASDRAKIRSLATDFLNDVREQRDQGLG
jgi:transcriptional regulator with XRE-family HTH domain